MSKKLILNAKEEQKLKIVFFKRGKVALISDREVLKIKIMSSLWEESSL
ncbi:hypothetical protein [Blattabacterium cuenoti]|nr:hypothetical protein [Blattabacterium cuenoti]